MLLVLYLIFILPFSYTKNIQDMINFINNNYTGWTAGLNWSENKTMEFLPSIKGGMTDKDKYIRDYAYIAPDVKHLPKIFDARRKWPYCDLIRVPRDQGSCGSCWAVSAASVISDRICIGSKGKVKVHISTLDIMACCPTCTATSVPGGCAGGNVRSALEYWVSHGYVTGGELRSNQGCKPYPESTYIYGVPPKSCEKSCTNPNYTTNYKKDLHKGGKLAVLHDKNVKSIQSEILTNGPVAAALNVYDDFLFYKEGVYRHTTGESAEFSHAVKIIGWGVEGGRPYWLIVNTWGPKWGAFGGLFKMLRGSNECGIEKITCAALLNSNSSVSHRYSVVYLIMLLTLHFRRLLSEE